MPIPSLIAAAVVTLALATGAQATSSLSFETEGFLLDIVVGDSSEPLVSSLSIAKPRSQQTIMLPMQQVRVKVFDTKQRILVLNFENTSDKTHPESFFLSVKENIGTLRMGEQSLTGNFFWGM